MAISNAILNPDDKTVSTSRVTKNSGDKLEYYLNVLKGNVQYAIFKDGVMYNISRQLGTGVYTQELKGAVPAEYSLRVYCGTRDNQKTGCKAYPIFIKSE